MVWVFTYRRGWEQQNGTPKAFHLASKSRAANDRRLERESVGTLMEYLNIQRCGCGQGTTGAGSPALCS